jgi:hypothetical protein
MQTTDTPKPNDSTGQTSEVLPTKSSSLPWTPRTKKALAAAVKAARSHGCSYIGVEHVLYGLAADDSHVSLMLEQAGITPASISRKYDWHESKCFCGGHGWVLLVGTNAPNRKVLCPDCAVKNPEVTKA